MNVSSSYVVVARLFITLSFVAACSRERPDSGEKAKPDDAPLPTNRVAVPAAVRENLGIRFIRVERRDVAQTLRTPGRFELLPEARRPYPARLPGRVEVLVAENQRVESGTPLFSIESAQWRDLQHEIAQAQAEIRTAEAVTRSFGPLREAHAEHERALAETEKLWRDRVEQLEKVQATGGGAAEALALARSTLGSTAAEYADVREKDAELDARELRVAAELESARIRFDVLLASASTLLGIERKELETIPDSSTVPTWRAVERVTVRAIGPGVVHAIGTASGSWVESAHTVATVVDSSALRFHAHGLQSDLLRYADRQAASIVPASTGDLTTHPRMNGVLAIGPVADPESRSIDLYCTPSELASWARPGVTGFLEVEVGKSAQELAIPRGAVARDGVTPVIFRRDPRNENQVIRLEADLGVGDGRWIVVKSGITDGDEVVLDGVYQLMLATSGTIAKGGHFHADGTFHASEED
jgi:multidrug resistance efflux pump